MFTKELEVESFLNEYKRSRVIIEATVRASLNRALEFEMKFKKPFYEFTTDEILEVYKSIIGEFSPMIIVVRKFVVL